MDVILYNKLSKLNGRVDELNDITEFMGINEYDPSLQTSETISPHYFVNGEPYSSTQYDNSWNCTAMFEIEPSTTYTIGLVPGVMYNDNEITKPWYTANQGIFFYDDSKAYISQSNTNTFTTPSNTRYARFNYFISANLVSLNVLNKRCMIVKGSSLPTSYNEFISYNIKKMYEMLVGNYTVVKSINLYDPSKQTPSTISPHYFVNGVPYSSTQFDGTWNCTDFIPVKPSTKYSLGLVPEQSGYVKPWATASYGYFCYDINKEYISSGQGSSTTFTTPSNCAYIRFNYYKANGKVSLDVLNASCMLVEGDALPTSYSSYGTILESDLQKSANVGFEWKISEGNLYVSYGYDATHDYVVVMNNGRANGLFDFDKLMLKPHDKPLHDCDLSTLNTVWASGTDMHSPFQFNAVNNADGYHYDATSAGFVGGNHTLDQMGSDFKKAESVYTHYFADGTLVTSGYGRATQFAIRWANNVQAYNTVKEGGGGRACLTEYHEMIFDGVQFNETVKLVALEDIYMSLWYGLQFVSWGTSYTNLRFMDAVNRTKYTSGSVNSGNLLCSGVEAWGTDHRIILTIDNGFDLGKREFVGNSYTDGAFTSSSKGYFRIITKGSTNFTMSQGDSYYLKGSFRFCKAIAEQVSM